MISYIKAKNCFSFLDEVLIDFRVNNKAPDTQKYVQSSFDEYRVSKMLSIIGPNASGKSNLLRIVYFLKWFLVASFGKKPDTHVPLEPFRLKMGPFDPAEIEVEFETGKTVYRYKVTMSNVVLSEQLDALYFGDKNEDRERRRFRTLFNREYDAKKDEYIVSSNADFALSDGVAEISKKRKNASLISAAIFSDHEKSIPIKNYWSKVHTNIKQFGSKVMPVEIQIFETAKFYYNHAEYLTAAEKIIAKCDLGLVGLKVEKLNVPTGSQGESQDRELYLPYGKHRGMDGIEIEFPFHMESSGSQRIFVLLSSLLPVLKNGGVAVIDELEADLHPNLLPAILDLFVSPQSNPKSAQLVFTCHATPMLNVLDKYQIVIVEKDEEGISEAWRLDEVEGVRNDDNFYSKYSSGAFGGIPEIGSLRNVSK